MEGGWGDGAVRGGAGEWAAVGVLAVEGAAAVSTMFFLLDYNLTL